VAYTPPTLVDLRGRVARDLRDPQLLTFATADIDDFINFGIAEVNRVYPLEGIEEVDIEDVTITEYATLLTSVWRVEVWRNGEFNMRLTPNDADSSRGGWEIWNGNLSFPSLKNYLNADTDIIRLWGYRERDTLTAEDDVLESDIDAELGVRTYAAQQGYSRLISDRSLFQQWQTQSNNSDVSPTQLNGMYAMRVGEWDTLRNRIRRIRRVA